MGRGNTSYLLVSSTLPDEPESPDFGTPLPSARPRFYYLLPLIAFLDVAGSVGLAALIIKQESEAGRHDSDPDAVAAAWEREKLVFAVLGCAVMRASTIAIVGVSRRMRDLGIIVAAVCILSALYNVSVANLLFQARPRPAPGRSAPTPEPWQQSGREPLYLTTAAAAAAGGWYAYAFAHATMPVLIGYQMAMTLLEWISYIAVVGVKVPPGGNPVKAKRWARNLARDPSYRQGVEVTSLYATDSGEDGEEEEDEYEEEEERVAYGVERQGQGVAGREAQEDDALLGQQVQARRSSVAGQQDGSSSINYGGVTGSPISYRAGVAEGTPGSRRGGTMVLPAWNSSPGLAEMGMASGIGGRAETASESESDPDEIIDIPSNPDLQRQESRRRLALAAHPERRMSSGTISLREELPVLAETPRRRRGEGGVRKKLAKLPSWLTRNRKGGGSGSSSK